MQVHRQQASRYVFPSQTGKARSPVRNQLITVTECQLCKHSPLIWVAVLNIQFHFFPSPLKTGNKLDKANFQ